MLAKKKRRIELAGKRAAKKSKRPLKSKKAKDKKFDLSNKSRK